MKIQFLGAAHEVTGSCTLLRVNGKNIVIDCGMEQGADIYENRDLPIAANDIDYVLLTHVHIDHAGKIPMLVANGYSGPIYTTGATKRLCEIMLMDSAHIQETEANWRNKKALRAGEEPYIPPYTVLDVQNTLPLFVPCDYERDYNLCDGLTVKFIDAGHLLGSASILVTTTENGVTKKLLFSGDIGNIDRPLIRNPQAPTEADIVVIESTYGNRVHGERKDYMGQLTEILQDTFDRGGNVVIPSFAVGRTQELLYLIREIKEKNLVKNHDGFQVWVDSPLAVEATKIYSGDMMDYYDKETLELINKGINVLSFKGLFTSVTSQDSIAINENPTPKVIISASGMCEAGRIRHHLKHNLWRHDSTVLFVGYQAEGTLGRLLIDGADTVKLFKETVKVNCRIAQMDGISGHADMNIMLDWLKGINKKPEQVFVNHGQDTVCDEFATTITETLGIPATAPYNGALYDILSGECLDHGNRVRIVKPIKSSYRTSSLFDKLMLSVHRLTSVAEKHREAANKDIAKLTSQITELCNKWDR